MSYESEILIIWVVKLPKEGYKISTMVSVNPKIPWGWGGGVDSIHRVWIRLVFLQFLSKLLSFFLVKADINCHFLTLLPLC